MWYIWKARNDKTFTDTDWSPLEIIDLAHMEAEAWILTNSLEDTISGGWCWGQNPHSCDQWENG